MVFGLLAPSAARADLTSWQQATAMPFGFGVFEPSVSEDGRYVAFRSAFDFTGENPEANFEVFRFDRLTGVIDQLTVTSTFYGNFEPAITPDGGAVVFRSSKDFTGGNPDGSFELYEVEVGSGSITQLTSNGGSTTISAHSLSEDGSAVVYLSNGDGTHDVMLYRRATAETITVTQSPYGFNASQPVVNHDGSRIVFRANYDFDGSNPDHSLEFWRWAGGRITHVTQTASTAQLELPSLDASGKRLAFVSRANLAGGNPGTTREIFLADLDAGTFAQVTPSAPTGKHLEPILSPDGSFLLFESDRDPVGLNQDKNRELFRYDVEAGLLSQVTDTIGGASIPQLSGSASVNYASISSDGKFLAYRSEHELDPRADDPDPQANLELFVGAGPVTIVGDLNGDAVVDAIDLSICVGAWGASNSPADLDGDGVVGPLDMAIVLGAWS